MTRFNDFIICLTAFAAIFASDILRGYKDWVSQEFVNDSAFVLLVKYDMK